MKKVAVFMFIVVLAIGAYIGYLFFFKDYNTADEQVDRLADEDYQLEIPDEATGKTKEEIVSSYRASYDSMMTEAEQRMEQIAAEAHQEYRTKVQNGEDISFSYFFSKYKSAADRLEESTDKAFKEIYQPLKSSLKAEAYGTEPAEELEREYNETIKRWRSNLLRTAKETF